MISSFSFAPASGLPQPPSAIGMPQQRMSRSFGLILAVLLHVLGVWMLIARDPLVIQPPSVGTENAITYIAPLAEASAPQPVTPPVAKPKPPTPKPPVAQPRKPRPKPPLLARSAPPRRITPPQPPVAATEPLTPAPNMAPTPDVAAVPTPPGEDFSARIDAARKRRADAQAQDPTLAEAPTETESQRANRIARENIAFSQRGQGAARDQSGGIFEMRNVGLHRAEFGFRGWSPNSKRNALQMFEVEQGTEVDIEQAVVTKVIGVIRVTQKGEFPFDSRRLGRIIILNAAPAYEPALRTFLLKEFFPTYVRSGTNGAR